MALFFALGGVGYAKRMVHLLDGSQIKKASIQLDRLSAKAQRALKGQKGDKGDQGTQGTQGTQGIQGIQGNQGNQGNQGSPGPSAVMARINGLTIGSEYGPAIGIATASGTDHQYEVLSPNHDMVARDFSVKLTAAPGTGNHRIFIIEAGGGEGVCVVIDPATTCTAPGPIPIPASSPIEFKEEANPAIATDALIGWRLTDS